MPTHEAVEDQASDFFGELGARGQIPMLARLSGTMRIDLTDGGRTEHWYLTITKGDIEISRHDGPADAVLVSDKELFDGMVKGKVNAMAAVLRNVIRIDGDLGLLVSVQRLFPGPEPVAGIATSSVEGAP
jgi:putative sterol carrier protein